MSSTTTISATVALLMRARVPIMMWGEPGTGKTAMLNNSVRALNGWMTTVIAAIREPSEFVGLPVIQADGNVKLAPPVWAMQAIEAAKTYPLAVVFFDEASCAPPATQAALLRAVHEGVVGDTHLPDNIVFVAAGNPPECAAGGWDLSPPMANRFAHLNWAGCDIDEWAQGIALGQWPTIPKFAPVPGAPEPRTDGGPAPEPSRAYSQYLTALQQGRTMISAFLHARPGLLHSMPKDPSSAGRAWPSRRTWDLSARALGVAMAAGYAPESAEASGLVEALVGTGPATEFIQWARSADLPNPEDLIKNPESYKHPKRGDLVYAVLAGVATAVIQNMTRIRWEASWKIMAMAAKAGSVDLAAGAARALANAGLFGDKKMQVVPEMNAFMPVLQGAGLVRG